MPGPAFLQTRGVGGIWASAVLSARVGGGATVRLVVDFTHGICVERYKSGVQAMLGTHYVRGHWREKVLLFAFVCCRETREAYTKLIDCTLKVSTRRGTTSCRKSTSRTHMGQLWTHPARCADHGPFEIQRVTPNFPPSAAMRWGLSSPRSTHVELVVLSDVKQVLGPVSNLRQKFEGGKALQATLRRVAPSGSVLHAGGRNLGGHLEQRLRRPTEGKLPRRGGKGRVPTLGCGRSIGFARFDGVGQRHSVPPPEAGGGEHHRDAHVYAHRGG